MGVKAVLYKISTDTILKKFVNYPKIEVTEIVGLDPDLEWYIVYYEPEPSYDNTIEKLVKAEGLFNDPHPVYPNFKTYKVYYQVVALTQEEIDTKARQKLDSDAAAQFFNRRKEDGMVYIDRFSHYVYRRVVNNEITKAQAIAGLNFFYDAIQPLEFGYFELANTRVAALVTGNADLLALKTKITNELTDYLNNE